MADLPSLRQRFVAAKYFGSLDGLRCLSIVPVVWHHAAGHRTGIAGSGHLGVHLFFVISGFLITTLLLRERDRTGTISLGGFYLRRTLRIFPLYYAVLAVYVLAVATIDRHLPAGRQFFANLPAFLTYTSNWFVDLSSGDRVIFYFAWSLATEEQFYLMWPSVVRFARSRWTPVAFMSALLLLGEGTRWASGAGLLPGSWLAVRIAQSIMPTICLGCLAAFLLHHPVGFGWAARLAGHRVCAPLAACLVGVAVAIPSTPLWLLAAAMTYLVVTCTIRPDHGLRLLLELRPVRYVGVVSYGIYLLHLLCVNLVRRVIAPGAGAGATFALSLALAIGAAALSHRYFEARFLRLKERRRAPAAVVAVAPPNP